MKITLGLLMLFYSFLSFSQNYNKTKIEKIKTARKLAKKFLRKEKVAGMSISISQNGQTIWSEGFGYAKRQPKTKVKPDQTLFRIASISKCITALALAKLVEENTINLDESIYTYLPDYPKKEYDFTVRELAGHIAGIRSYKGNEFLLNKKISISQGVDLFKNDALLFEPSTQFSYNTFGYVLLSAIIQKTTKTDFNSLIKKTVFEPLRMTQTLLDESNTEIPNRSQFYVKRRVLSTPVSNEYKVAGGGLLSTTEDLIKLGQEIISPTIVSKKALTEITTSQKLKSGNITGYGIGFSIDKTKNKTPKYYHTGGGVGASTMLSIYPKENIVICILNNTSSKSVQPLEKRLESLFID